VHVTVHVPEAQVIPAAWSTSSIRALPALDADAGVDTAAVRTPSRAALVTRFSVNQARLWAGPLQTPASTCYPSKR